MATHLFRLMQTVLIPQTEGFPEVPWRPAVDVYRTPGGWLVKFELAGVETEDIALTVQGQRLILQGIRRDSCPGENCCCYVMEISYSRFERTIELPCNLDTARIEAEFRQGMLITRIQTETPCES